MCDTLTTEQQLTRLTIVHDIKAKGEITGLTLNEIKCELITSDHCARLDVSMNK